MVSSLLNIVFKSIRYNKRPVLYQVLIIALLSAVITGSLLTGRSVRTSLKRSATERLGNTGIIVSSGIRSFNSELAHRLKDSSGIKCSGIFELSGYCQNLSSQKGAFNTHIYAINDDFFSFQGIDSLSILPGEVAVNQKLAVYLGVKPGDDLIVRFREISDIPPDAPFAPASEAGNSLVLKVGSILSPSNCGNFNLSISQIMPMNIFINLADLKTENNRTDKINRLLIDKEIRLSVDEIYSRLKNTLKPSDIGLRIRSIARTGETEIVSDRIFIDDVIIKEIRKKLPSSAPVLTYLGNRFEAGSRSTPYSFIAAMPSSIYPEIAPGNGAIINKWLADDLLLNTGDSVRIYWYSPDELNKLVEKSSSFIVRKVVDIQGIWSDSLLMPDFPGISGSASCSDWDAGVPIKMGEIRDKDENYWNRYRGTPKVFINYEKGKELWANNFGPATAIRLQAGLTETNVESMLRGSLDPALTGFMFTDLAAESVKAAEESVDFGTLFLGLGFFLIIASIVLLSFAVSSYFNIKKGQLRTLFSLGFKSKWIKQLLLTESAFISLSGCLIGAFAGYMVSIAITFALNTVWRGAVQTDTLKAYFSFLPVLTGFAITLLSAMVFMVIKIRRFLKRLNQKEREIHSTYSPHRNMLVLIASVILTITLYVLSVIINDQELTLSFAAGILLLITLLILFRQYLILRSARKSDSITLRNDLSRLYYSFNPSHAVTPILFIAAGIFAVFITAANRMDFGEKQHMNSSGTGGYLLWCENTIPIKEDLSTIRGKSALGLDIDSLTGIHFVSIKRSSGDDASCLNLNHITAPPLLGIDQADFIARGSFSFVKRIPDMAIENPWQYLSITSEINTIYGIADQTVLDWGLKIKPCDTLVIRAENGQPLKVIIAAGLQSSVFQGYVLIGKDNFSKYYPSVSGSSVLLVDGKSDFIDLYKRILNERLENFGINIEKSTDRLASFYEVTNTYLSVFGVFGVLGMITGIGGLGFVLLRNYNQRRREFALMLAAGFSFKRIRKMILAEQILILMAGVFSGVFSAILATLPTIKRSHDMPWFFLVIMVLTIIATGLIALFISIREISEDSLTASLKNE
jgi:putative ABC transport system permease protein